MDDLVLDPSDPLNLLLQSSVAGQDAVVVDESNNSSNSNNNNNADISSSASSSSASSPSEGNATDWSQLSTLWDGAAVDHMKSYNDMMDFSDLSGAHGGGGLPGMDLDAMVDFDPTMGLDPSSMHYGGYAPYDDGFTCSSSGAASAMGMGVPSEMLMQHLQFPFTFQGAMMMTTATTDDGSGFSSGASSSGSSTKERRLSVGSSASGSGSVAESLSPMPSSAGSPSSDGGGDAPAPPPPPPHASSATTHPSTPKVQVKQQEESPRPFDPALELAERVRQTAGVMLAVPMSGSQYPQAIIPSSSLTTGPQPKIQIPRMPRHSSNVSSSPSTSSSAASTPPPATPPMASAVPSTKQQQLNLDIKPIFSTSSGSASASTSALPTPTTTTTTAGGRPKTSHTTIERRYRTNLNARIQSLRMAVPALRVLEDRDGGNGKKIKKNLKDGVYLKGAGIGIDGANGTVDVIDERGFVDGVKVARKCSKANVLGKAVEYIRVLKKREGRLRAEQAGLKALVCGLVGGPALVKEWEVRWRERFGGEERDEVEGEEAEEFDSDEEDGEGEDGEDLGGGVGKKRKRAKTSATASPTAGATAKKNVGGEKKGMGAAAIPPPNVANVISQLGGTAPGAPGVVPEKRKRGRPRKVPVAPTPVATLAPQVSAHESAMQQDHAMHLASPIELHSAHHHHHHRQQQPQQYLLAVFALFSFFNSPLTSSFGSSSSSSSAAHQHTGILLNPPLALAPEIISQFTPPTASPLAGNSGTAMVMAAAGEWGWREYVQGFHLAVSLVVLASFVCSWMGLEVTFRRKVKSPLPKGDAVRQFEGKEDVDWEGVCARRVLGGTFLSSCSHCPNN